MPLPRKRLLELTGRRVIKPLGGALALQLSRCPPVYTLTYRALDGLSADTRRSFRDIGLLFFLAHSYDTTTSTNHL